MSPVQTDEAKIKSKLWKVAIFRDNEEMRIYVNIEYTHIYIYMHIDIIHTYIYSSENCCSKS